MYSAFLLNKTGEVILNGPREIWKDRPFVTLGEGGLVFLRTEHKIVDIAATLQSCFFLTSAGVLLEITEDFQLRQLETPRIFTKLYAGLLNLFGHTKNDKLWGIRGSGACLGLGRDTTPGEVGDTFHKMALTKVIGQKIVKVASGLEHTLVLRSNGSVWVCGVNEHGEIGLSNNKRVILTPTELARDYFRMNTSNTGVPNRGSPLVASPAPGSMNGGTSSPHTPTTARSPLSTGGGGTTPNGDGDGFDAGYIIDIAAGANWSVFLDANFTVYVCGDNTFRGLGSQFDSVHVFGVRRLSNDLFFRSRICRIFCSSTQTFFCSESSVFSTTGKRYTPKRMQLQGKFVVREVSASQNHTFILSDPVNRGEARSASSDKKISKEEMQIERLKNELEAMRLEHDRIQQEQDNLRRENIDFKLEVEALNRTVDELRAENKHLSELSSSDPFMDIRVNVSTLLQTVQDHAQKRDRYLAEYNFKHNDKLDDIAKVVRELLSNERVFLTNLQSLKRNFIEPYDAKYSDRDPLPMCFREIDLILGLSSKHLSALEEILYPWLLGKRPQKEMEADLAKHFLFYSESFKLFKQYMIKHEHMIEALKDEPLKSFVVGVAKQLKAARTSGKDLYEISSLLILPIQHSCRLSLYMERLANKIPKDDPNKPIIQEALEKIKEIGNYNNERLKQEENARTLQDLQEHISHHFIESHRKLLFIDEYAHRIRPSGDLVPCRAYICSDLLILIDSSQFETDDSKRARSTLLIPSSIGGRHSRPRTSSVRSRLSMGGRKTYLADSVKAQLIFKSKVCEFEANIGGDEDNRFCFSVAYITTEGTQERRKIKFSEKKFYERSLTALQIPE